MKTLGVTLKEARELMGLTLRQVEEFTEISNAYLSQLENDKIKKPSANVLYKLANAYSLDINNLYIAAGIIQDKKPSQSKLLNSVALSSNEQLTPEEEEELLKYLRYLRSRK